MSSLVSEQQRLRTMDSTKLRNELIAPDRHSVTPIPEYPFVPSRTVRFKFIGEAHVRYQEISQACGSFCAIPMAPSEAAIASTVIGLSLGTIQISNNGQAMVEAVRKGLNTVEWDRPLGGHSRIGLVALAGAAG